MVILLYTFLEKLLSLQLYNLQFGGKKSKGLTTKELHNETTNTMQGLVSSTMASIWSHTMQQVTKHMV